MITALWQRLICLYARYADWRARRHKPVALDAEARARIWEKIPMDDVHIVVYWTMSNREEWKREGGV